MPVGPWLRLGWSLQEQRAWLVESSTFVCFHRLTGDPLILSSSVNRRCIFPVKPTRHNTLQGPPGTHRASPLTQQDLSTSYLPEVGTQSDPRGLGPQVSYGRTRSVDWVLLLSKTGVL